MLNLEHDDDDDDDDSYYYYDYYHYYNYSNYYYNNYYLLYCKVIKVTSTTVLDNEKEMHNSFTLKKN